MKKLALILLLAIFVLSQFGYYCFFEYQIYCAKQQAKEQLLNQIPEEQLTKISSNPAFFCEDEEVSLNGQMFDVVKRVSQNGKEYLLCIADVDEATALKKLTDLVHSGSSSDSNGKDGTKIKISLQNLFCKEFYLGNETLFIPNDINYFCDYSSRLSELSGKIPLPPPKL